MIALLRLPLHWQILLALLLAVIAGALFEPTSQFLGISFGAVCDFIGTLFLNALKMLIVPLVVASIICGMMDLTPERLGR